MLQGFVTVFVKVDAIGSDRDWYLEIIVLLWMNPLICCKRLVTSSHQVNGMEIVSFLATMLDVSAVMLEE